MAEFGAELVIKAGHKHATTSTHGYPCVPPSLGPFAGIFVGQRLFPMSSMTGNAFRLCCHYVRCHNFHITTHLFLVVIAWKFPPTQVKKKGALGKGLSRVRRVDLREWKIYGNFGGQLRYEYARGPSHFSERLAPAAATSQRKSYFSHSSRCVYAYYVCTCTSKRV